MTFPNAAKGVKILYIAELLALLVSIASLIAPTLSLLYMVFSAQSSNENPFIELILTGCVYFVSLATLVHIVFIVMGLNIAAKDDSSFKVAFYAMIFGIIITIVGGIFSTNEAIKGLTDILYNITNLITAIYIIQGVVYISKALGNHRMRVQGNHIIRIISLIYVFQIFTSVSMVIFGDISQSVLSAILTFVVGLLSVIEYVLFILYLSRTKTMLAEN